MSQAPILIVDDNPAHRQLVKRAIRKAGFSQPVIELGSLQEARSKLLSVNSPLLPHIAIVDLNLGDGRSTALLSELRASVSHQQLPILVLSTSALESDMKDCYDSGANCYITKADDTQEFAAQIAAGVRFLLDMAGS